MVKFMACAYMHVTVVVHMSMWLSACHSGSDPVGVVMYAFHCGSNEVDVVMCMSLW